MTAKLHRILAIDPGSEQSAWLVLEDGKPAGFGIMPNAEMVVELRVGVLGAAAHVIVIEKIESYGMAVGREVFDTVWWSGRFAEAAGDTPVVQMPRREVKVELCGAITARDSNIRWALIDRFGGKDVAVGRKDSPGPLHGISKDCWSALAIAETYRSQQMRVAA